MVRHLYAALNEQPEGLSMLRTEDGELLLRGAARSHLSLTSVTAGQRRLGCASGTGSVRLVMLDSGAVQQLSCQPEGGEYSAILPAGINTPCLLSFASSPESSGGRVINRRT